MPNGIEQVETLEFKNFIYSPCDIQASYRYSADIYVNGSLVMRVSNDGGGKPDIKTEIIKGAGRLVDNYLKSNGTAKAFKVLGDEVVVFYHTLDRWCLMQVRNHVMMSEMKAEMKEALFYLNEDDEIHVALLAKQGFKFTVEQVATLVKSKYKVKVVLNLLPDSEAFDIWCNWISKPNGILLEFTPKFNADGECINIPTLGDMQSLPYTRQRK